jgi:hypothetical protein
MAKKKKEIRIIKKDSNKENYTFVNDGIIANIKNNESPDNENKSEEKSNERIENERIEKKIYSKKVDNKGRKTVGKSLQGHSPIYE